MQKEITVKLLNEMNQIQWFTVTDNVSGKIVLDGTLGLNEVRTVRILADANGRGDLSYLLRGIYNSHGMVVLRRPGLEDGEIVDMN